MSDYKQMDKVLNLAAKTGDKVIVVSDHHEPYVVMALKEYESLLQGSSPLNKLSEQELLDKINRDIAVWKSSQDDLSDYSLDQFRVDSLRKDSKNQPKNSIAKIESDLNHIHNTHESEEEDRYYIEPVD